MQGYGGGSAQIGKHRGGRGQVRPSWPWLRNGLTRESDVPFRGLRWALTLIYSSFWFTSSRCACACGWGAPNGSPGNGSPEMQTHDAALSPDRSLSMKRWIAYSGARSLVHE
jgi:hypothetical protein